MTPNLERPLAVVMVTDPTEMTLSLLRQTATWCDIVVQEATATTSGQPRTPLRAGWHDVTGLPRPQLRVITTDLAGTDPWHRQRLQRNSITPLLIGEARDRIVLMVDSDEFLDPEAARAELALLDEPQRLRMVPHYAAIDRVARSIHCCQAGSPPRLREPGFRPRKPYRLAGPSAATAEQMLRNGPTKIRFGSPVRKGSPLVGSHITLTEPAERVSWKLTNMRHSWHPRVLQEQHLDTMMSTGIHHAGWWIAEYREPEPWLVDLAERAGLRECGKPLPEEHLQALRTWAEIRLRPELPDGFVALVDDYAARRDEHAHDFLTAAAAEVIGTDFTHRGYADDDATAGATPEDVDESAEAVAESASHLNVKLDISWWGQGDRVRRRNRPLRA